MRHVGQNPGTKLVNESIEYTDAEGNLVVFPEPTVSVECDVVVNPESCPVPADLTVDGCSDSVVVDLGDTYLESLGRIIQMDVTVKNVCPGKRVALAVLLSEVDESGMEYQRGMKAITIPAHNFPTCRDVLVKCIKFVVPESLDVYKRQVFELHAERTVVPGVGEPAVDLAATVHKASPLAEADDLIHRFLGILHLFLQSTNILLNYATNQVGCLLYTSILLLQSVDRIQDRGQPPDLLLAVTLEDFL